MGKMARAAAALRGVAEMYRGLAIAQPEIMRLGGLVRAEYTARVNTQAAIEEEQAAKERSKAEVRKYNDLIARYHAAIREISTDRRTHVNKVARG